MKRFLIISALVLTAAAGAAVWFGYFPVASVDGKVILYKDVRVISGALGKYKGVVENRDKTLVQGIDAGERAVLNELILKKVVLNGSADFPQSEINREIEKNLNDALKLTTHDKIQEAAKVLYGLSYDKFIEVILKPEAREVVVRNKVEAAGGEYAEWLKKKVDASKIKIYFLPYKWNDGKLADK